MWYFFSLSHPERLQHSCVTHIFPQRAPLCFTPLSMFTYVIPAQPYPYFLPLNCLTAFPVKPRFSASQSETRTLCKWVWARSGIKTWCLCNQKSLMCADLQGETGPSLAEKWKLSNCCNAIFFYKHIEDMTWEQCEDCVNGFESQSLFLSLTNLNVPLLDISGVFKHTSCTRVSCYWPVVRETISMTNV